MWDVFKVHHYLSHELNKASTVSIARWGRIPVGFMATMPRPGLVSQLDPRHTHREHRFVIIPDYQGLGIGTRLSDATGARYLARGVRYLSRTAHVVLRDARRRSPLWVEHKALNVRVLPGIRTRRAPGDDALVPALEALVPALEALVPALDALVRARALREEMPGSNLLCSISQGTAAFGHMGSFGGKSKKGAATIAKIEERAAKSRHAGAAASKPPADDDDDDENAARQVYTFEFIGHGPVSAALKGRIV